jgi:hypothetical protein
MAKKAPRSGDDPDGHFAAYEEHAKTLRTWLVAYGVGCPLLILGHDSIWQQLAKSGVLPLLTTLFLAGVAVQVMLSAVNKSAMWVCYYGHIDPDFTSTLRYKAGHWLSTRYSIDLTCDVASLVLFSAATYFAITALRA